MIPLLFLPADTKATFITRPNRFLARVKLPEGQEVEAHVHDPGRLPQLLYPQAPVLLKEAQNPKRRTKWSLLAAKAQGHWVFTNSGYHRLLTEEILKRPEISPFGSLAKYLPEPQVAHGRLDYLLETTAGENIYVEVKGCTLAQGETALFPDAPTTRGTKHLRILKTLKEAGFGAVLWFLIFRPETKGFAPAEEIDPAFTQALNEALQSGVKLVTTWVVYDGKWLKIRP